MALRRVSNILPSVLSGIRRDRSGSRVSILTLDETPECLFGLLGQAVESGLIPSMADVSVRVNGRMVTRNDLL